MKSWKIIAGLLPPLVLSVSAWAQDRAGITVTGSVDAGVEAHRSSPDPFLVHGAVVRIDHEVLRGRLAGAPMERPGEALSTYGFDLALPDPAGRMVPCFIAESPIMAAPLAAKFPEMRTYLVVSADGRASGRLELTQRGLTAMLRTVGGAGECGGVWMIDGWPMGAKRDPAAAVSFWMHDLRLGRPGCGTGAEACHGWTCHTVEGPHGFGADALDETPIGDRGPGAPVTLRTVRLAVACTGEYGLHQCQRMGNAPNAADPLAAIVTTVARTNVVYESDLAVRFVLVAANDRIVYFDPSSDPYPTTCDGTGGSDCSGVYLAPNISTLSSEIGNGHFDVGHLLTRVFGGVAYLSSVCGSNKAGGISGIVRGGDVEALNYLVLVHELGHQFGARHTFSGIRGRCAGNVTLNSAWEAGSGSSPMAYAGGCPVGDEPPSDNVAIFADPYFHHGSLAQMRTVLNGINCPGTLSTANTAPVIASTTPSAAIPPGTPFVLSAVASDAEGDPLVYSWEQFDSGVARALYGDGSNDNGQGALFRIFPPVDAASRTFPRMSSVLSAVPSLGEQLPTATGVDRRFRVVVRDNKPGAGGATTSGFVTLTVPEGTSPFTVAAPAAGATLDAGVNTVSWTVGGTNAPPISCATVTIRFSDDDGATFGAVLGTFPNTGSAQAVFPGAVAAARVRIDADGGVFFAVSGGFAVRPCPGDFNGQGGVTPQDIFDFLNAYFAVDPAADVNGSDDVSVQDIFDFLGAYFVPC